jgi:hypothetical protein
VIDAATAVKLAAIKKAALAGGRDLMEALDGGGLLVTADRHRQILDEALRMFHTAFERAQPHNLLQWYNGRQDGTPLDMFRATLQFLEHYMDAVSDGKTEQMEQEVSGP